LLVDGVDVLGDEVYVPSTFAVFGEPRVDGFAIFRFPVAVVQPFMGFVQDCDSASFSFSGELDAEEFVEAVGVEEAIFVADSLICYRFFAETPERVLTCEFLRPFG
jgi:hypothetical protein